MLQLTLSDQMFDCVNPHRAHYNIVFCLFVCFFFEVFKKITGCVYEQTDFRRHTGKEFKVNVKQQLIDFDSKHRA